MHILAVLKNWKFFRKLAAFSPFLSKNFEKENIVKPHYYSWNSTKIDPARSFLGAFSQFLFRIVCQKCFLVTQRNFKEIIEIIHSVFNFYQSHFCDVNKITCLHERADEQFAIPTNSSRLLCWSCSFSVNLISYEIDAVKQKTTDGKFGLQNYLSLLSQETNNYKQVIVAMI